MYEFTNATTCSIERHYSIRKSETFYSGMNTKYFFLDILL